MKLADQYSTIASFLSSAPVNVTGLSQALGIDVRLAKLNREISGMLERKRDDKFIITLNENHPKNRQRFTLAHELGHYMLHRHLVGDGVDDNRAYRSTDVGKYHNTCIGPKQETEANKFAANILMPSKLIEAEVGGKAPQDIDVKALAEKFGVSEHSMSIRLGISY